MAFEAKTARETIDALGTPLVLTRATPGADGMLIGRWRHDDANVATSRTDAVRVLMSLSSTQRVRYQDPDHDAVMEAEAGDVGILPAGVESSTSIEGGSDILQVFVDPATFVALAENVRKRRTLVGGRSEDLRAAMVRLFVARSLGDRSRRLQSTSAFRRTVARLLRADATARHDLVHGGLPPAALRRVNRLMAENELGARQPSVRELAEEARISLHHFIRAFRSSVGVTPHQRLLARRHQRALGLLADGDQPVAAIADALGFSSHAYFTASFRERFGATPSEYRHALAASIE